MPGIGQKSAQRLAFYILSLPIKDVQTIATTFVDVRKRIQYCSICWNLSLTEKCDICNDSSRDPSIICVVDDPKNMLAIEKTNHFKGHYHILGGVISPLDRIGPEQLRIKELLQRLRTDAVKEIILAFNPSIESESTILYLARLIQPLGLTITRIACGVPMGSDLEYADEFTLGKSLDGRINA